MKATVESAEGDLDGALTVPEGLYRFFNKNGIGFGTVDIFCFGPGNANQQIRDVVGLLAACHDSNGQSPICQFTIVLPASAAARAGGVDQIRAILERLLLASGWNDPGETSLGDRLRVVVPPDLRSESLLSIISQGVPRSVILVLEAAVFRAADVESYEVSPHLPEDFWAPQLHALAERITNTVKSDGPYTILHAGQALPHRPELQVLLQSIEPVGVLGCDSTKTLEGIVAEKSAEWTRYLAEGRLGAVWKSIEGLPPSVESEKPFLRIQMLHRAGFHGQALEAIEALPLDGDLNPHALAKLADIAVDAGADFLATKLLDRAVDELDTPEALELALATAGRISDKRVEDQLAARLAQLYPDSAGLHRRRIRKLAQAGDYHAAAAALAEQPGADETRAFYEFLGDTLGRPGVPDYLAIREGLLTTQPSWAASARAALVEDALRRGLIVHAVELALRNAASAEPSRRDAGLLLETVEGVLLSRNPNGELPIESEQLKGLIKHVISYLSAHPSDGSTRLRLTSLLSAASSGRVGLILIASATLDFVQRPIAAREKERVRGLSASELEKKNTFIENAFNWLDAEGPLMPVGAILPVSLVTEPADEVLPAISEVLLSLGSRLADETDIRALLNWLTFGLALVPHGSDPDQDLELIRLAAGRLAAAGRVQQARDLAEQALQASQRNPRRQRLGWLTMADIYHRFGNRLETLIALACSAAATPEIDAQQAWHESNLMTRVLRDVGLTHLARIAHERAGDLLDHLGVAEFNRHRHEFMGLQIDFHELLHAPERIEAELGRLFDRMIPSAREALAREDDVTPAVNLLGQLIRIADEHRLDVPPEARTLFTTLLDETGAATIGLVRAMSALHPAAQDVLELHRGTERARYADDVAYDLRATVLAARRLLSGDDARNDPETAAFAIEMLTDRAIATPGWETTGKPAPSPSVISEAAAIAKAVSAESIAVVLAGLDADHRLVRVTAQGGVLGPVVREDAQVFSGDELLTWRQEYPYRYGIDDQTFNLFHTSTEHLGVSELPAGRVLFVADTEIQTLPPNLLRIGEAFAGEDRAMAMTPSLSWLAAARAGCSGTTGKLAAWISTDDLHGRTLALIADGLRDTLATHNVDLDTGPQLPEGLAGSELVVIAAHGCIAPEGRFFQSVSNEGRFAALSQDFARALRNVGIVVLFVCSGGRADKHPEADTTIGLAKQLLDRGCSVVIASPWPLDAGVPYHWLPVFLDSLACGAPVIDANFRANMAVSRAFGADHAKCMAMSVLGDALKKLRQPN
jgi:tetratricopeptide (TPR) repeat protein